MRIADVLRERDDGEDGNGTASACSPSRYRWSLLIRWFCTHRKKPAMGASCGGLGVLRPEVDVIGSRKAESGSILEELAVVSGEKPKEVAFNLGMGLWLAFLLAGNGNELRKMVDLRKQMEELLKEIKVEVQKRGPTCSSCMCSSSDVVVGSVSTITSTQQNSSSSVLEMPKHSAESSREKYEAGKIPGCMNMDQLEAELRVEHLVLDLEGRSSGLRLIQSKSTKSVVSSESSTAEWYDYMPNEHYGVSAYQLERRLHELLQARQEERIAQLESALEFAQQKLLEKEAELSCWKKIRGLAHENEEAFFSLSIN
ncbi:hypothetical protein AXF42_Ash001859 [Apostasia shenzhenica]|uniref:Protein POLAR LOCALIZATION DURING ASYMMETRIC DIVISION AND REDISTRIBUTION n=1 Tax=Apostasia shenzhenica TaxID=1088818 RepID=A0A2I0ABE9_9ASPA|nr:hypothetical protein AXF42_Ash001859 [Apostasia shenzhenica]